METVQASALNVDPRYGPGVVSNGGVNCGGTRTSSNDRNEKVPSRAHKIDSQASTASLSSSSSPTSSSAMTSHQNVGPSSSSSGERHSPSIHHGVSPQQHLHHQSSHHSNNHRHQQQHNHHDAPEYCGSNGSNNSAGTGGNSANLNGNTTVAGDTGYDGEEGPYFALDERAAAAATVAAAAIGMEGGVSSYHGMGQWPPSSMSYGGWQNGVGTMSASTVTPVAVAGGGGGGVGMPRENKTMASSSDQYHQQWESHNAQGSSPAFVSAPGKPQQHGPQQIQPQGQQQYTGNNANNLNIDNKCQPHHQHNNHRHPHYHQQHPQHGFRGGGASPSPPPHIPTPPPSHVSSTSSSPPIPHIPSPPPHENSSAAAAATLAGARPMTRLPTILGVDHGAPMLPGISSSPSANYNHYPGMGGVGNNLASGGGGYVSNAGHQGGMCAAGSSFAPAPPGSGVFSPGYGMQQQLQQYGQPSVHQQRHVLIGAGPGAVGGGGGAGGGLHHFHRGHPQQQQRHQQQQQTHQPQQMEGSERGSAEDDRDGTSWQNGGGSADGVEDSKTLTPEEKLERSRVRNRDHSRRSRQRKKALVEGMKQQVTELGAYRMIVEQAHDLISAHSMDDRALFLYASGAFQRLLGIHSQDLLGIQLVHMVHPEDVLRVTEALRSALLYNQVTQVRYRLKLHARGEHTVETSFRTVPTRLLAVTRVSASRVPSGLSRH